MGAQRDGTAAVLIVEPHEIYRRALAELIGTSSYWLAGEAASRSEALHAATDSSPDAILLCLRDAADTAMIRNLSRCAPSAAIVATSFREDGELLLEALHAGAAGFVPKRAAPDEIIDTIRRALAGETAVHPSVAPTGLAWAVEQFGDRRRADNPLSRLTGREREVVGLLAQGLSARSIALSLFLSRRTVEGHLANAYRKLGVRSRIEAVQFILRAPGAS